jgi:hypothetical protein
LNDRIWHKPWSRIGGEFAPVALAAFMLCAAVLIGCAGSEETREGAQTVRVAEPEGLRLAEPAENVATVQLYPTGREGDLPVLELRGGGTLTLRFDLLGEAGRPLSVYFYHADRTWRRDLVPSQYLATFQRDDILGYSISQTQGVRYSHHAYRFPNEDIQFLVSGNYVVRVTEQGLEDEVLFERPFFVTEDAGSVALRVAPILTGSSTFASAQPVALYAPPPALPRSPFDYATCFARNGRFEAMRCADRSFLAQQPNIQFELDQDEAFAAVGADYVLDLSRLAPGRDVESVDLRDQPFEAVLQPDLLEFPDLQTAPSASGQPLVQSVVDNVVDPNTQGEYVETFFSFVPPFDARVGSTVRLVGSFNGWQTEGAPLLDWVPGRERYEGSVLLKQGVYQYGYVPTDPGVRGAMRRNAPRFEQIYTAFVYFDDVSLQTDRLMAVQSVIAP